LKAQNAHTTFFARQALVSGNLLVIDYNPFDALQ
jgi:hypothetical protein